MSIVTMVSEQFQINIIYIVTILISFLIN